MNVWTIEPHDPLIVRDGRPFDSTPGARAVSLEFPFPSTTTGGVRTRDGLDADGRFQKSEISRVKQIGVRGPLPVELDATTGEITQWLAPRPADALLLDVEPQDSDKAQIRRLVPLELETGTTDLPDGLSLVGMPNPDQRKPCKAPRYWYWRHFEKWLLNPSDGDAELADFGHDGPVPETRTHVSIDCEKQTAQEGLLFQTRGLEFTRSNGKTRLALAVATDAPNLKQGLAPLGGERRLVHWRYSHQSLPHCPAELKSRIMQDRHCRVLLLTPAYFLAGSQPSWLLEQHMDVTPSLQAVAISKYQVVSGWDFEKRCSKPTRRLAPAGTVMFVSLAGDRAAIERWVDATWMQCISDEEQDRRDGFGLAVLGVWDGKVRKMEV